MADVNPFLSEIGILALKGCQIEKIVLSLKSNNVFIFIGFHNSERLSLYYSLLLLYMFSCTWVLLNADQISLAKRRVEQDKAGASGFDVSPPKYSFP